VDQLVLFSTTFKREELPDEQTDTTVIPEICAKHTRKNDKLSHLPAFHRPSRTERQPRSGPAATQPAAAEPL